MSQSIHLIQFSKFFLPPTPPLSQLHPRYSPPNLVVEAQCQCLRETQAAMETGIPFFPWHPYYSGSLMDEWNHRIIQAVSSTPETSTGDTP